MMAKKVNPEVLVQNKVKIKMRFGGMSVLRMITDNINASIKAL